MPGLRCDLAAYRVTWFTFRSIEILILVWALTLHAQGVNTVPILVGVGTLWITVGFEALVRMLLSVPSSSPRRR